MPTWPDSASSPPPVDPLPDKPLAWHDVSQALERAQASRGGPVKLSVDSLKRSVRAWASQIVELTRRAEAAEARVIQLENELAEERDRLAVLGRRFGQLPHESFPAFVVRLGMVAKAQPLGRETRETRALRQGTDPESAAPGAGTA